MSDSSQHLLTSLRKLSKLLLGVIEHPPMHVLELTLWHDQHVSKHLTFLLSDCSSPVLEAQGVAKEESGFGVEDGQGFSMKLLADHDERLGGRDCFVLPCVEGLTGPLSDGAEEDEAVDAVADFWW